MKVTSFRIPRSGLIAPAIGLALLLLLSPAFSQDKKARCEAKKEELAKLEKKAGQLSAFVIPPVRTAQIKLSRDDLSLLNNAMSELSSVNWESSPPIVELLYAVRTRGGFSGMAEQYDSTANFDNVRADDKESLRAFIAATRSAVISRINLLKSFDENPDSASVALRDSQTKVEEQRAELARMKCDETATDENDPATEKSKKSPCDLKKQEIADLRGKEIELRTTIDEVDDWIGTTREDLGLLNHVMANISDPNWRATEYRAKVEAIFGRSPSLTIFAERYGLKRDFDDIQRDDANAVREFILAVRPFVIKRLDRLLYLRDNPKAARDELKGLQNQIDAAISELEELRCDETGKQESVCSMEGSWTQYAAGLGRSTWHVTSDGKAIESGLGASTGTASMTKNVMRIEWSNSNGWSGYYEWTMDADCQKGTGTLVFKSGGSGSRTSTVEHN